MLPKPKRLTLPLLLPLTKPYANFAKTIPFPNNSPITFVILKVLQVPVDKNNNNLIISMLSTRNIHGDVQTSAMLFWIGVPVSRSLFRHLKTRRLFHRELQEISN